MNLIDKLIKEGWLILPGGSDINPSIYGKENYKSFVSQYSIKRDINETKEYKDAVKEGRPIFGICRGMQLMSALNGLTLIQDMQHGGSHMINVLDPVSNSYSNEILVNNAHHQCVWTENKLEGDNYKVYGYCSLSQYHDYQENEEIICTIEPEIIHFPEVKGIATQFHPEWMDYDTYYNKTLTYLETIINKLF